MVTRTCDAGAERFCQCPGAAGARLPYLFSGSAVKAIWFGSILRWARPGSGVEETTTKGRTERGASRALFAARPHGTGVLWSIES